MAFGGSPLCVEQMMQEGRFVAGSMDTCTGVLPFPSGVPLRISLVGVMLTVSLGCACKSALILSRLLVAFGT